jgi:nitrogenase-stabilizing/protective protein
VRVPVPELAGLAEAEDFFEALAVPYDPRVLALHRLHLLKVFGLALGAWLDANPDADGAARRAAASRALREAHAAFADDAPAVQRPNPFAPGLVQLGRPR